MTLPSHDFQGFFPRFDAADLARLAGPLPTWALSTESPWQQWGLAEGIVRGAPGNQVLMSAAAGLLSWSWQQRPLHAPVLGLLLTLDAASPCLAPEVRARLAALKKRLRPLPQSPAWEELRAAGDRQATVRFLEAALSGPAGAAWLGEAWEEVVSLEDRDLAASLIRTALHGDPGIAARMQAELDHHHGLPASPGEQDGMFSPFQAYLCGREAAMAGDFQAALSSWLPLTRVMPWNVNLILAAHDAARLPAAGPLPGESVAVLAYSWNKAELISQTLDSVFASDIGGNAVFVLDNGSTDETPQALKAAQERYGPERLRVVTLPVNVGAPAARNWLLSLPEVRARRFAAFLDDDVVLPANWLSQLLHTALRHPGCSTVGCAIRDHVHPHRLQSADYHLLHRLPGEAGQEPGERLRVFSNCAGALDLGHFAYERPCLSVSGCCHLLDLSTLDQVGSFDVRFTPTQFDDLDRDIRCFLAGRPCVYSGRLAVDHVQRSSMKQASSQAQVGHIVGNKIKLEAKYDDGQLDALVRKNFELAWGDLLAKQAVLLSLEK